MKEVNRSSETTSLLNEMLKNYNHKEPDIDALATMSELYDICIQLLPVISCFAQNDEMCENISKCH